MKIRYAAPAVALALIAIIALVILSLQNNSDGGDSASSVASPTVPSGPNEQVVTQDENATAEAETTSLSTSTPPPATPTAEPSPTAVPEELTPAGRPIQRIGLQFGASRFVFDGEHIWVASIGGILSPDIKKLDIDGNVIATYQVARASIDGLAYAHDSIWIVESGEGRVKQISKSGEELNRITLPSPYGNLAADGSGMWVITRNGNELTHVNLTGQIDLQVDADSRINALLTDDGQVFALSTDALWAVDPENGHFTQLVDGPGLLDSIGAQSQNPNLPDSLQQIFATTGQPGLVSESTIWVAYEAEEIVVSINRNSGEANVIPLQNVHGLNSDYQFATDGTRVWVTHVNAENLGAVSEVTELGQIVDTEIVGGNEQPNAVAFIGEELWVGLSDGALVRIPTED